MAKEKPLFEVPKFVSLLGAEQLVSQEGSAFDLNTVKELSPYIHLVNKPKTKGLKSQEGADFNTGEMGDPVELETEVGWSLHYYPPLNKAASVMLACGFPTSQVEGKKRTHESNTFYAAIELVDFLLAQGWKGFYLEEGSDALSWAVWACLKHRGYDLKGFKASDFDQHRYDQSIDLFEKVPELKPAPAPRAGRGFSGSVAGATNAEEVYGLADELPHGDEENK